MRSRLIAASRQTLAVLVSLTLLGCGDRHDPLTAPEPVMPAAAFVFHARDERSGAPLEGVQIVLQSLASPLGAEPRLAGMVSDAKGVASIATMPPGRYAMSVRRIGYQRVDRPVDLRPGEPVVVSVPMATGPVRTCYLILPSLDR